MFGIGSTELILIAVFALLLFGPDKLPEYAKTFGKFMRQFNEYKDSVESTIRAEVYNIDPSLTKLNPDAKAEAAKATPAAAAAGGSGWVSDEEDEEDEGE